MKKWLLETIPAALMAVVGVLAAGVVFAAPAHAATPPSFTGCTPIENGNPQWANDQYGRWVWFIIKYRCNTGKEYSFKGTLYQNPDGQGGYNVGSDSHGGVDTAPYLHGSIGNCDSTTNSKFFVSYRLEINNVVKNFSSSTVTLPCHFN